jgi:predicted nucleic acid-binding Zn finger protein
MQPHCGSYVCCGGYFIEKEGWETCLHITATKMAYTTQKKNQSEKGTEH